MDRALDEHPAWVHEVHLDNIGGDSFLVGRQFWVSKEGKSEDGDIMWISIHHIQHIFVYDSFDALKKSTDADQ